MRQLEDAYIIDTIFYCKFLIAFNIGISCYLLVESHPIRESYKENLTLCVSSRRNAGGSQLPDSSGRGAFHTKAQCVPTFLTQLWRIAQNFSLLFLFFWVFWVVFSYSRMVMCRCFLFCGFIKVGLQLMCLGIKISKEQNLDCCQSFVLCMKLSFLNKSKMDVMEDRSAL